MNLSSRLAASLVGAAAVVSLTGCSDSTPAGVQVLPVATSIPFPDSPPPPPPTGSVGGIDVAIDSRDDGFLSPGGRPFVFTVALTNMTSADIPEVGLVVSLGQCPCGDAGATEPPPAGSMHLLDPVTREWVTAPYVAEGTGVDYHSQYLVPPFVLRQGQTVTYHLELQLDPDQTIEQSPDSDGSSVINVAVTTPSASGHAATWPVAIKP